MTLCAPNPLLDTILASEYCGISRANLANLRSDGTGPTFRKRDGRVYYRRKDLDRYMKIREESPSH